MAKPLRLGGMNLENLFSPGVSFYGATYTDEQYYNKVGWIARQIVRLDVHVIGLTELGSDADQCVQALQSAIAELAPTRAMPHYYAGAASLGTPIRNAVLSRFPLADQSSLVHYPINFQVDLLRPGTDTDNPANWVVVPSSRFSRPVAQVQVRPPQATPFNLLVVHLKSKRPKTAAHDGYSDAIGAARSAIMRNVEAAALRTYLDDFLVDQYDNVDRDVPTFLVGDFNDTPTSVPVEIIRGPFDARPGPASTWTTPDKRRLLSCARLHMKFSAYQDKLYSYVHDENFSLIDQIFASEHVVSRFDRFEVYNDHVLRHQDWGSNSDEARRYKSEVSDHGIVVAEFKRMISE